MQTKPGMPGSGRMDLRRCQRQYLNARLVCQEILPMRFEHTSSSKWAKRRTAITWIESATISDDESDVLCSLGFLRISSMLNVISCCVRSDRRPWLLNSPVRWSELSNLCRESSCPYALPDDVVIDNLCPQAQSNSPAHPCSWRSPCNQIHTLP